MPPFTPLRDRVLIAVDPPVTVINGIEVPEALAAKQSHATVVAVGSGRLLDSGAIAPPEVAVGDRVIFEPGSGTPITIDGVEYVCLYDRLLVGRIG